MMKTDEQYTEILKERLSERRFYHSLEVAKSAKHLAKKYGADENKAYTAGLLHDVFKDAPKEEQLSYIIKNDIEITKIELNTPKLYHAICGAHYLKHALSVDDDDILSAVRYHTTGRAGMSVFEKIIFVADFISADRDYKDVDVMRKKAERSLEEAIVFGAAFTIEELSLNERFIHPDTVAVYNDALEKLKEKKE